MSGLGLRAQPPATEAIAALAARYPRIGLDGLLARRGRGARRHTPGLTHAVRGLRWRWDDQLAPRWWPQGVDVQRRNGRTVAVVSWYAQERRGTTPGARLTFVDVDARHPRYHHVLLVAPSLGEEGPRMDPVAVHAGGVAWSGDRLFVAATRGGLREFRLGDLLDTRGPLGALGPGRGPAGARAVLPQHAELRATTARDVERLRYSFVSLESDEGAPALVVGEYATGTSTRRLVRVPVREGGPAFERDHCDIGEVHDPGILRMQGALVVDGRWFVSSSNGDRAPGDLWVGTPDGGDDGRGGMRRLRHALEVGPEDLAVSRETGELWNVSEFPWRRTLYSLDLGGLLAAADALGPDAERPRPPR